MRLCTFKQGGQAAEVGIVEGDLVYPVQRWLPGLLDSRQPMLDLIERWGELRGRLQALPSVEHALKLDQVHLLAPVPRPGKVLGIGLNYVEHVQEQIIGEIREVPKHQVWFSKLVTAVNGPFDPIMLPAPEVSDMVDYEAELVVIIGQRCKHVPRERAHEVIFGYCVGNDVSVRDWQKRTPQWILGKSFDTHAPFGPWVTTSDAVPDPHALGLRGWVNGDLRQNSHTSLMIFNIWEQIALLSQAMTLEPGDVIYTGTCSGVGAGMKPPSFLRPGDRVRMEVEGLGAIEATCQREAG